MQRLIETGPHVGKPALTKAEILITRRCQLRCSGCSIIRVDENGKSDNAQSDREEIPMHQWNAVLENLRDVGCGFLAIYGAEPALVPQRVASFVNYATNVVHIPNSVITSGIGLTEETLDLWWDNGLKSLTMSVDALVDSIAEQASNKSSRLKTDKAYHFLSYFSTKYGKEPSFRDIEGCQTITLKNVKAIPELVRVLTDKGCWWHGDIVHWNRGQPYSKVEPLLDLKGLVFETDEDIALLRSVIEELIRMKDQGFLIHPSKVTLQDVINFGPKLTWQCCHNKEEFLGMCSIDPDGTVRICDDLQPPELRPTLNSANSAPEDLGFVVSKGKLRLYEPSVKTLAAPIVHDPIYGWELSKRFEEFKDRAKVYVRKYNCTCSWSTHQDAERIYSGRGVDLEHYVHRRIADTV